MKPLPLGPRGLVAEESLKVADNFISERRFLWHGIGESGRPRMMIADVCYFCQLRCGRLSAVRAWKLGSAWREGAEEGKGLWA